MVQPKPARPPRLEHFVWWDTPGKRLRRALCGALVRAGEECGSHGPTCPDCRRALESLPEPAAEPEADKARA
jgi:hypothetical protein